MTDEPYPDIEAEVADDDRADRLAKFWEVARIKAGLDKVGIVVGSSVTGTIPPPAWAFGDTPQMADELVAAVLDGRKTATSSALEEYGDEMLPEAGELAIILDGSHHPRALIRTISVDVVTLGQVDAQFAVAEGEGDGSLEAWRTEHREFFSRILGRSVDDELEVVCERFEVCYP